MSKRCWSASSLLMALGLMGCGAPEEGWDDADGPTAQVEQALSALPLPDGCYRLRHVRNGRMLDAYTSGNGRVMTRDWQNNTTQVWCFTLDNDDGIDRYRVQHRSYSGQYLDAYEGCCDYDAVLRDRQNNATQKWYVLESPNEPAGASTSGGVPLGFSYIRLRQSSSYRYLDAYTLGHDYQAVTRDYQSNNTQDWAIFLEY